MAKSFKGAELASFSTKELLPNLVDTIAATEPEAIFAEYPVNPVSYESGYQKFSYGSLANAADGIAWWLQEKLGPGEDFPTLAYIGPNDIVVNAFLLGAVKTGYKVCNLITPPPCFEQAINICHLSRPFLYHQEIVFARKKIYLVLPNVKLWSQQAPSQLSYNP